MSDILEITFQGFYQEADGSLYLLFEKSDGGYLRLTNLDKLLVAILDPDSIYETIFSQFLIDKVIERLKNA